jgi:hypothetical protein
MSEDLRFAGETAERSSMDDSGAIALKWGTVRMRSLGMLPLYKRALCIFPDRASGGEGKRHTTALGWRPLPWQA